MSLLQFKLETRGGNNVPPELSVEVKILDINDHAPVFRKKYYEATLNESVLQGDVTLKEKQVYYITL